MRQKGIDAPTDASAAMAFNGGIAYSGGPCGAITGAAMAVGLLAEQRELGALHESLLASAGSGIFGIDLYGRGTFVNDAACAAFGFEREELIGVEVKIHSVSPCLVVGPGSGVPSDRTMPSCGPR